VGITFLTVVVQVRNVYETPGGCCFRHRLPEFFPWMW
jgi:hypothetical protein